MFSVRCPVIDDEVLLWPSALRSMTTTPEGIEVGFRCACGAHAMWRTGRQAARRNVLIAHPSPVASAAGPTT